ncbi:MAG: ferrochelatase, partial [Anaerolineales bacterium]
DALSQSIRDYWDQEGLPDRLLFSFHGIPERYERLGDPYRRHCQHTAEQVATRLGLQHEQWQVAYQSRFGPEPWLQPYTDEVLAAWAEQKINSVHAIAPGFSADCLETLDEIDREYRELFEGTSGGRFHYIPALNTRPDHIEALAEIAATAIRGWLKPSSHTPLKHTREAASP